MGNLLEPEALLSAAGTEIAGEFALIKERAKGKKVVVVQGLGFVGAAVAAVIASALDKHGEPAWFVIGVDLPTQSGLSRIARINQGQAPVASPDPDFERFVAQGVNISRNLTATAAEEAYALADVIVIDVQLDVIDRRVEAGSDIDLNLAAFEGAVRTVGKWMRADALVLVETTVPIGACSRIVLPALAEERSKRGITAPVLLAHAYERVMPGPHYIASIKEFWRSYSGIDATSSELARSFLESFTDFSQYPPWHLQDTTSSELGKLLENSYRAANIAFIHEWTLLAERAGVNLWEIVNSIRVRKGTHDNMRYPGFGVGGYCLTKDSLLAQWSANTILKTDVTLDMTLAALRINYYMPLHALDLVQELAGRLSNLDIVIAGIAYVPDVVDTRNSPAEVFVDAALEAGARVIAHDPCVTIWNDRPGIQVNPDWHQALAGADAIVLAVPHSFYKQLQVADFPKEMLIVDANNVLSDTLAKGLKANGCRLLGVGKGHWRTWGLQNEQ